MLSHSGESVTFDAWYSANKQGAPGLTVLVDVYDPSNALIRTGAAATETGGGFYTYTLAGGALILAGNYRALFRTTDGSVDSQHIPALWIARQPWVERVDVPASSRAPLGTVAVDVVSAGTVGGLLQLIIGASYTAAHGTALTHTLTPTDPDLSGATVTLEVGPHGGPPFLTAPVVVSGPTSAQVLTTELTSAGTGACPESRTAQWAYWADWGGSPAARVVLRGGPAFLAVAP